MYALGVSVGAYRGSTNCLSENVCTTCIRHGIHTTRLYKTHQHNLQIGELGGQEKLAFMLVIKIRCVYLDRVRIQFILTHKNNTAN